MDTGDCTCTDTVAKHFVHWKFKVLKFTALLTPHNVFNFDYSTRDYCIVEKFGSKRLWQFVTNSPKFCPLIILILADVLCKLANLPIHSSPKCIWQQSPKISTAKVFSYMAPVRFNSMCLYYAGIICPSVMLTIILAHAYMCCQHTWQSVCHTARCVNSLICFKNLI